MSARSDVFKEEEKEIPEALSLSCTDKNDFRC